MIIIFTGNSIMSNLMPFVYHAEPIVDDESTISTINHTNSSVIIPLPSTSEMKTLSTTNSNTASSSTMETIISVTTSTVSYLPSSVYDSSGSESSIIPPGTFFTIYELLSNCKH